MLYTADCQKVVRVSAKVFCDSANCDDKTIAKFSQAKLHMSLSLLQLRRTEPYAAPITQKIIVALWGYD
jgi:hypothetical protein